MRISKENCISFLVLLPYYVGRYLNRFLYIKLSSNAYMMPTTCVMLLLTVLFFVLNLKKQRQLKPRKYAWLIGLVILDAAMGIIFTQDKMTAISVWLRLCLPMVLSLMIVKYCWTNRLNFDKILVGMLKWFTLYTALMMTYYILFRGLFSDSSVRFNPRGGGSVIFGYTVTVAFSLALCVKEHFRSHILYLILVVLTLAALATGSRGAVWPIALMWVLNFMLAELTSKKVIVAFALTCVMLFLSILDVGDVIHNFSMTDGNMLARIFRTGSIEREETFQNAASVIAGSDALHSIFGYGTGSIFPIQKWEMEVREAGAVSNHFIFHGKSLLVQPHNTFLYALMENGWIGFALWMLALFFICRMLIKNRNDNYVYQIIFVGTVVFVNLFDSIMFIQPGVAADMWLMMWCVCEQSRLKAEKSILGLGKAHDKLSY